MSIFHFKKIKKQKPEFVKDPIAFIQFLRIDDEQLVSFGQTSLVAVGVEVIPPMIELLTNEMEDDKVRRRVGVVLSKIGHPAIAPLLEVLQKQNLQSKSSSVTIGMTAAALSGIGKSAVPSLIQALKSDLHQVRFGAAIASLQTGEADGINAVRKAYVKGDLI